MGFIEDMAPLVQKYAKEYGIGVCSPIIAQGILESASGTSSKAKHNNFFGLKYRENRIFCHDGYFYDGGSEQNKDGTYKTLSDMTKWFSFDSYENGIRGYFQFINTPTYANLKGVADPRTYLELIKKDGYATSLKYVDNLMAVIKKYDLTKYDNMTTEDNDKMGYVLNKKLAHKSNHGGTRKTSDIKFIVMHYTSNMTDTAFANASYFQSVNRKASAHYFCDRTSVYQSVEDNVIAWSVGGSKYSDCAKTGGGKYYKICTNTNSISIELCSTNGEIAKETINNAVELTKSLMVKYNIPQSNVIRHFDVTGKRCPAWNGWLPITNESKWNDFKNRLTTTQSVQPKPSNPSQSTTNPINVAVQKWINEYLGTNIDEDGKFGDISKRHLNMCLEKALGLGVRNGVSTTAELSKITYSKVKASAELTKVLEAYLYVRGFNPQDFSGIYSDNVANAVKEFQRTVFKLAKDIDGKAGNGTFTKIVF